ATNRVLIITGSENLSIDSGCTLDLADNGLILDYDSTSPAEDIEDLVRDGNNAGDWLGDGITSSLAANDSNYVVGVADNALLASPFGDLESQGGPLFSGQDMDLSTVLLKVTFCDDIDLNG